MLEAIFTTMTVLAFGAPPEVCRDFETPEGLQRIVRAIEATGSTPAIIYKGRTGRLRLRNSVSERSDAPFFLLERDQAKWTPDSARDELLQEIEVSCHEKDCGAGGFILPLRLRNKLFYVDGDYGASALEAKGERLVAKLAASRIAVFEYGEDSRFKRICRRGADSLIHVDAD